MRLYPNATRQLRLILGAQLSDQLSHFGFRQDRLHQQVSRARIDEELRGSSGMN